MPLTALTISLLFVVNALTSAVEIGSAAERTPQEVVSGVAADAAEASNPAATDAGAEAEPATTGSSPALVPPARDPQAELKNAQALYTDAAAAGQYQQAIAAAEQIIALTGEIHGANSLEQALAISQLAAAQGKTDDLAGAAASYRKSIDLIEEQKGIVAPELVEPLTGLAAVQNAMGEWDRGLDSYSRALRLNHVEQGLSNLQQMPIRDGLTDSYLGLGAIKDANFQQEVQLRIVRDEYGSDLGKLVAASSKLANWYSRTGQKEKHVIQLETTIRTIRSKSGNDAAIQIQTLRDLAAAYQQLELSQDEELNVYNAALEALTEALRINNASAPPDLLLGADLQVAIGDVHNYYGATRDARRSYMDAWQTLVTAGAGEDVFDGYFGAPTLVGQARLPAVFPDNSATQEIWRADPDRFRPGSLQAVVDVSDLGRTDNVRIVESTPEGLIDDRAAYLLKRYQYRPRFENGQAVATPNLAISHSYSYLPEGEDAIDQQADDGEADAGARLAYPDATE